MKQNKPLKQFLEDNQINLRKILSNQMLKLPELF